MPRRKRRPRVAAVIGGGKMGVDIAAVLAAGGWRVHLQDPVVAVRQALPAGIASALRVLRAKSAVARQIELQPTLQSIAWREVELVVEAVPEVLDLKQRLFREIEALAPRQAILTTNTSSLRLKDVMKHVKHRDRALGVHWSTPAILAPLVEVVRGTKTSSSTVQKVDAWLRELGKLPVHLQRDVPGMIVNRVQHAMMREAFDLLDRGIASAEDIDTAVRYGFGFRYAACGPIRQRDLNGLKVHLLAAAQIYPTLNKRDRPPRVLSEHVRAGRIGVRAGAGFYRWNPKTLASDIARIDKTLKEVLALMARDRI